MFECLKNLQGFPYYYRRRFWNLDLSHICLRPFSTKKSHKSQYCADGCIRPRAPETGNFKLCCRMLYDRIKIRCKLVYCVLMRRLLTGGKKKIMKSSSLKCFVLNYKYLQSGQKQSQKPAYKILRSYLDSVKKFKSSSVVQ